MQNFPPLLLAALLALGTVQAQAQALPSKVYRCGNSYSQTPCAEGPSHEVMVDDARSSAQKTQTEQATQRNAQAADALEKTRLQEEQRAEAVRQARTREAEKQRAAAQKLEALERERAEKKDREDRQAYTPGAPKPKAGAKPKSKAKKAKSADFLATTPARQP